VTVFVEDQKNEFVGKEKPLFTPTFTVVFGKILRFVPLAYFPFSCRVCERRTNEKGKTSTTKQKISERKEKKRIIGIMAMRVR
jgi:hypothetical protein